MDHPRRCGENTESMEEIAVSLGSPPQVRGKRLKKRGDADERGITPAGAGKTVLAFPPGCAYWDHPRRCGENVFVAYGMHCSVGSPPQVGENSVCCTEVHLRIGSPPQVRGKLSDSIRLSPSA